MKSHPDHAPYILLWRDTGYFLIGPFRSEQERASWSAEHGAGHADDPRWQAIDLRHIQAHSAPPVLPPELAASLIGRDPGFVAERAPSIASQ